MDKFIKENKIKRYSTFGEGKSVMVERFNRTLKTEMWKIVTEKQTHRWIDKLLEYYNYKEHSGIDKWRPAIVSQYPEYLENRATALCHAIEPSPPKLQLGDKVRISRWKGVFEKGYEAN